MTSADAPLRVSGVLTTRHHSKGTRATNSRAENLPLSPLSPLSPPLALSPLSRSVRQPVLTPSSASERPTKVLRAQSCRGTDEV